MADISCDTCLELYVNRLFFFSRVAADQRTWAEADIVKGKLRDTGVQLHEQGQRLSNATSSTQDGHFGGLKMTSESAEMEWPGRHKTASYLSRRDGERPALHLAEHLA